ncbi:MAG TPA: hypothetical protein V6C86_23215 [Oculatellaceae cyanobacterium]
MIEIFVELTLLFLAILFLPFIAAGLTEKIAASRENRKSGSVLQPLKNFVRLLKSDAGLVSPPSSLLQFSMALTLATTLLVSCLFPWLSFRPTLAGDDIALVLYLLVTLRLMDMLTQPNNAGSLSSPDTKQREYLRLLIDPLVFVVLSSLGFASHSSNLSAIFELSHAVTDREAIVWIFAGLSFFLFNLLYRVSANRRYTLSVTDPTIKTERHSKGTSGKNIALKSYAQMLQSVVCYGASVQCLLHALTRFVAFQYWLFVLASVVGILLFAFLMGLLESAESPAGRLPTRSILVFALLLSLGTAASALAVMDANFSRLPKSTNL